MNRPAAAKSGRPAVASHPSGEVKIQVLRGGVIVILDDGKEFERRKMKPSTWEQLKRMSRATGLSWSEAAVKTVEHAFRKAVAA